MAELHPQRFPLSPLSWDGNNDHGREYDALVKASLDLDTSSGSLVGGLIRFQVADGYANYLVTGDEPLTLQHVPFLDGYSVADYTIRGLRREDVKALVDDEQKVAAWFASKKRP